MNSNVSYLVKKMFWSGLETRTLTQAANSLPTKLTLTNSADTIPSDKLFTMTSGLLLETVQRNKSHVKEFQQTFFIGVILPAIYCVELFQLTGDIFLSKGCVKDLCPPKRSFISKLCSVVFYFITLKR